MGKFHKYYADLIGFFYFWGYFGVIFLKLKKIDKKLSNKIKEQMGLNVENFNLGYSKIDLKHIYNRYIRNDANRIPMFIEDIYLFLFLLSDSNTIANRERNKKII